MIRWFHLPDCFHQEEQSVEIEPCPSTSPPSVSSSFSPPVVRYFRADQIFQSEAVPAASLLLSSLCSVHPSAANMCCESSCLNICAFSGPAAAERSAPDLALTCSPLPGPCQDTLPPPSSRGPSKPSSIFSAEKRSSSRPQSLRGRPPPKPRAAEVNIRPTSGPQSWGRVSAPRV